MEFKRLAVPLKEFSQFVRKHIFLSFFMAAAVLLIYGKMAFSTDFYMDAEVILNNPHTMYNWGEIGRFGLIALKYIMGNGWHNPYFEAVLFLAALWVLGIWLGNLLSVFCQKADGYVCFLFGALFLFYPTHADQFQFRFQSFEVVLSMLFVVLATRYFHIFITEKNYPAYILAVILDVFAYATYQSMANFQICFHIAVYLFTAARYDKAGRNKLILKEILHFLISFLIYEVIAKLFFSGGNYLSGQIGWFSGDFMSVLRNICIYIKNILLGLEVFYPVPYLVTVIGSLIVLVWIFLRRRDMFLSCLTGFVGLLASPFFLSLIMGSPSPYRTQCMLPFVCAVVWAYIALWLKEQKKVCHGICVAVGWVFLVCQCSVIMRLFYTQDIIRGGDRITAEQIMARLQETEAGTGDKPVVFTGCLEAVTNGSCYTKDEVFSYLTFSVYEFGYYESFAREYFNTNKILGYFKTLGFHYESPSLEAVEEAVDMAADMESWPAQDSVKETPDYVVIKLSD